MRFIKHLDNGILFRMNFKNCGIVDFSNLKDISKGMATIVSILGVDAEELLERGVLGSPSDMYGVDAASIIVVVSPTGNIVQTEAELGQEFVIKEILRGKELVETGEKCWVYQGSVGFFLSEDLSGEDEIRYLNRLNVMYPDHEYLIFLNPSPLNEYSDTADFFPVSDYFAYIRLDGPVTETLVEKEEGLDFTEGKDYEFFSVSESSTELLNGIRKEIVGHYLEEAFPQ